MTEVLNPVQAETAIRELANRIANGVRVVSDRYAEFLAADRTYDQAVAHAYLGAGDRPAHERKHIAELATAEERAARDRADVAYQYARSTARALEDQLRASQSVNASIRAMYGAVGRGEGS